MQQKNFNYTAKPLVEAPTIEEVVKAVPKLKNTNNIPVEWLDNGGNNNGFSQTDC